MKKILITIMIANGLNIAVAAQSTISQFFSKFNTFSANFTQVVKQDGKIVQQSTGKAQLKKPFKFHWSYDTPSQMQLISDGQHFYHYDVELAQATVQPIKEIAGSTLLTLLSDKNQLDYLFNTTAIAATSLKKRFPSQAEQWLKKATTFYLLTPKEKKGGDLQVLQVIVGLSHNRQLSVFYVKDVYGENAFIFDNIKQNEPISDGQFQFIAPKGVDILGQ
ncbi:MAG: outer membrane lipoprotein chaperone LolA [Ostreibacterium sp.]